MTPSLKILEDTRQQKTLQQIEDEFKTIGEKRQLEKNKDLKISGSGKKKQVGWIDDEEIGQNLGEQLGL